MSFINIRPIHKQTGPPSLSWIPSDSCITAEVLLQNHGLRNRRQHLSFFSPSPASRPPAITHFPSSPRSHLFPPVPPHPAPLQPSPHPRPPRFPPTPSYPSS
ncbi:unnamed protein product [Closterium sp. NIES-54]